MIGIPGTYTTGDCRYTKISGMVSIPGWNEGEYSDKSLFNHSSYSDVFFRNAHYEW